MAHSLGNHPYLEESSAEGTYFYLLCGTGGLLASYSRYVYTLPFAFLAGLTLVEQVERGSTYFSLSLYVVREY